jgi:hypothetical protein
MAWGQASFNKGGVVTVVGMKNPRIIILILASIARPLTVTAAVPDIDELQLFAEGDSWQN